MKAVALLLGFVLSAAATGKTVKYDLAIERNKVNMSGKRQVDFALTVNGSIPAPTLEFNEGDEAEVVVANRSDEEVSIHWHGMLLPNGMDGVPYLTTPPIFPGEQYVFKFPLRQSGTYWYHSHTGTQEQRGVYGAIVIRPKVEAEKVDHDLVVMLSDWTDENPAQVLKNLKKDGDYYQFKKGSVRSILAAIRAGNLGAYLHSMWTRMGAMDLSDVGYDAFLINGKRDQQLLTAHPGQLVRLRLINGGASSYFYVNLGNQYFKVISADGQSISPVETKELMLGMAETYDILFRIPEHKNFELRSTAQDMTGYASAWIGMGDKEPVGEKHAPDLYAMDHSAHAGHGAHPAEHEAKVPRLEKLDYSGLRALTPTDFSQKIPRYEVKVELDGNMARYNWFINDKVISEDKYIEIKEGDVVRFVLVNKTMMHHPMHLHGHFFRVVNQQGRFAPLKHTVDVGPMKTETIEFLADAPGLWMLHCHNLYHLKTGMAKVVNYRGYNAPEEIAKWQAHDPHNMDHWYFAGAADAFSNNGKLSLRASQTRYQIDSRIESRKDADWTAEGELLGRRWLDKYWNVFLGGKAFHKEARAVAGMGYILPLLIESSLSVDSKGKLQGDLAKRLQWTAHFYSDLDLILRDSEQPEWSASLMYGPNWTWALGLKATNDSLGAGMSARF